MPTRTFSRRDFLKATGLTVGTGVVVCSGLTALATYNPAVITLPESTLGDAKAPKKILVAYASQCGSTGEVALEIGKTLAKNGASVEVRPLKAVADLSGYQAVLVGSAIRAAKWLREAVDFVSQNRNILQRVPVAYFTVCMTMVEATPANQTRAASFIEPVRDILTPVVEGYFAGKVDPQRLSFLENMMLQSRSVPQGDFRDWEKIAAWTQNTYAQICA